MCLRRRRLVLISWEVTRRTALHASVLQGTQAMDEKRAVAVHVRKLQKKFKSLIPCNSISRKAFGETSK